MMKKHLHNSLRALFLSLAVLLSLPMLAVEVEIDGINYEFDADTERAAVIKKSSGEYSGEIVIPESVVYEDAAYSVTRIGLEAFFICPDLTSVTIPNSVEYIGSRAFAGCTGLTSVTIGNSVTSIGDGAFAGCDGLTSVTIPNSVTSIGYQAFAICPKLLNVYCYAVEVPSTKSDAFDDSYTENPTLHVPAGSVENYKETAPWSGFENIVAISTEINGINYDLNAETKQATVVAKSSGKYSDEVIIPESVTHESTAYSVTSIGEEAFRDCSGLTSVTIPNSVTSIGSSAFNFCSGLTSVTIPNSVTSIGYQAFACSGLTSVTIGNNVESIGGAAFYDCSGLTSVTIPNSVTSIGYQAFCFCSGLTSVTIPNSVTSIGINAFALCSGLTSVTIGNGVESIGQLAFSDCSKLHDVYCYAKNAPSTESNAFEDSPIGTATLHVPAGSVDSYKTAPWNDFGTIVALTPFSGEVEIEGINYELNGETKQATVIAKSVGEYSGEIVIPESVVYEGATYSVTSIGEEAFRGCSDLTSVTIGNSVTSIGKNAFRGCSDLTSVTIGNSVASIGNYAFYECSGLTSVHISDIIAWCNIDFGGEYSNPLEYATLLYLNGEEVNDLEIPNSVTSIEGGAFSNCSGLTSVTIPNSVTSIGEGAFLGCSGLTSVTIPNSVESIGISAFNGCSGLTSVSIPNSVTSIRSSAFEGCSGLTSVHISDIIAWCNIDFGDSYSNPLYNAHHLYLNGEEVKELEIPNSVTSIGDYAFNGCSGLTSVTIPNSVTSIGDNAFYDCYRLTSVTIPNSVTSIGDGAFSGCSGLTSVTIPNSVTSIGNGAFSDCSDLTSVTIPNSVTSIGDLAFYSCTGLTSVTIGNGVESIGELAFANWENLLDVYCYAEDVPSTHSNAFEYSPIEDANLHVPAVSVERYRTIEPWSSFRNIFAISTEVEINEINYDLNAETKQATVVAKSSGKYSDEVIIPESVTHDGTAYSVTSIGKEAFKFCSGLTSVTIGNSVTSIGYQAFLGCSGLTSVTIPNSVESIGPKAFYNCYGLTSVTIGNSVTSIGDQAFCYCSGLTSVTIPNSVTSIGINAFALCSDLTSVTIGNGVESIGQLAFSKCPKLHDVYCYAVEVPSTESDAFEGSYPEYATLHVPAGSVESYRANVPWSGFGKLAGMVDVSSVGYATLYLDFNAEIPEGVEAYFAKEVVDNRLKMERVDGVLPANTGVIIMAEEGKYDFVWTDAAPATIEVNLFEGTAQQAEIEAQDGTTYYVLSAPKGVVGMYPVKLTNGMFPCMANKAYLPLVSEAHARICFDFGTETGIVETENGELKTENCYDLAGRKVQGVQKGIYIVGGKKVLR